MDHNGLNSISFDMPKNQSNVIKVIGVGGGGSNAINHMFQQGIKGVDFVICNTDSQALENSPIPNKIQLGVNLTEGLGAGANPDVGEQAAIESYDDIKLMLGVNTKMVFITAGMGGGTGTGAAPVIAKMARELEILTVAIVTAPFKFEGRMRDQQAQTGIEKLRNQVDSLIVINNNKLRDVYGNLGFKAGFSKADEVLATASRGIAEVITHHYTQNIDLRDAKTVLSNSGTAIMGSGNASGDNRAQEAITKALDSPLLNDNKITGAKNVLLLIVSGSEEITIDEIGEINDHIQEEAGYGANIIMGVGEDENLDNAVSVTVIATGFNVDQQNDITNIETKKIIHSLSDDQKAELELSTKNTSTLITPNIPKTEPIKTVEEHTKPIQEEIIRHDLFEDIEKTPISKSLLMPTTQYIKNMNVIEAEEINSFTEKAIEDDFVIINTQEIISDIEVNNNINVYDAEEIIVDNTDTQTTETNFTDNKEQQTVIPSVELNDTFEIEDENQTSLSFDFPININNIEVIDEIEVPSTPSFEAIKQIETTQKTERIVHRLEDSSEELASSTGTIVDDTDIAFELKKKTTQSTIETSEEQTNSFNPINNPISEALRSRVSERRSRMKEFNYKFKHTSSNIDEIEKQPAYKRAGLDIDEVSNESNISRTTLSSDSNDDLQIRKRNSFLHDNVD